MHWHKMFLLPASVTGSVSAAIEKLKEPGVNNLLSAGPIKNGGAVCECMLLSMSSSLFELIKKNFKINQVIIIIEFSQFLNIAPIYI